MNMSATLSFESLSADSRRISVHDLYEAYSHVCIDKGIPPLSLDQLMELLLSIRLSTPQGSVSLLRNGYILRCAFDRIKFIPNTYNLYREKNKMHPMKIDMRPRRRFEINTTAMIIILMQLGEIIVIAYVVLSRYKKFPTYLILARSGAAIILWNMFLLLVDMSNIFNKIMHDLSWKISTNSAKMLHYLMGAKILFGSVLHTVAHVLHVFRILDLCRNGCSYDDVIVVDKHLATIKISWAFFLNQLPYYSGIILWGLIVFGIIVMLLKHYSFIRSCYFYEIHRITAILFSIWTILHGIQHLLGLNLSYILVAPWLLLYLWSRRMEFCTSAYAKIIDWHASRAMIRICLEPNAKLQEEINQGIVLSAFVKQANASKNEWHPFTIYKNADNRCFVSIRNAGKWTQKLIMEVLHSIETSDKYFRIGHTELSCFRFYRSYHAQKLFFCSGIGITPFISIMCDPFQYAQTNMLIWSVNDITLLQEFCPMLLAKNVNALICFSNSAHSKSIQHSLPNDMEKFLFLQAVVHYYTQVDIVHGLQSNVLTLLERINIPAIISRSIIMEERNNPIGIFSCGGPGFMNQVKKISKTYSKNSKEIRIDVWNEHL